MSKQSKAKESQGYRPKPSPRTCANCAAFRSDRLLPYWMAERNREVGTKHFTLEQHGVEKNMRCGIGGFAVKKTATCNHFTAKGVAK